MVTVHRNYSLERCSTACSFCVLRSFNIYILPIYFPALPPDVSLIFFDADIALLSM